MRVVRSGYKKRMAGILGILLGVFGAHKFYLGYTKAGLFQLAYGVITFGLLGIVGFVEGIIYLTKSNEEFYQTYEVRKKPWF